MVFVRSTVAKFTNLAAEALPSIAVMATNEEYRRKLIRCPCLGHYFKFM